VGKALFMKKLLQRAFITALFVITVSSVYAGNVIIATVNNGAWKTGATWSGGVVPTTGDIAIIPAGVTVVYTIAFGTGGNEGWANPAIYVFGTLKFTATGNSLLAPQFNNAADVFFFSGSTFYDSQYANGFYLNNNMHIYTYAGAAYQITSGQGFTSSEFSVNSNNNPSDFIPAIPGTITGMDPVNSNNPNNLIVHNNNAPPVVVPVAVTNAATNITNASATLSGALYSTSDATSSIIFRYSLNSDLSSSSTVNASSTTLAAGASSTTLTASPTLDVLGGKTYYYRIEGVNSAGTAVGATQSFTTPCGTPVVTSNPANRIVCLGSATTYNITGTGYTAVRWQVNPNTGTFSDVANGGVYSNATTASLSVNGATAAMSGYQYRAVITNTSSGCNTTATSNTGTLTVSHMTFDANTITNVSCFGTSTGSATVNATAGTYIGAANQLTYSWSPLGGSAATASNLPAGTYTVTVYDAVLCSSVQTVVISSPAVLTAVATANSTVAVHGASTASATVVATGGTPAYGYTWSPQGGLNATASSLPAGAFTVTTLDAHGCSVVSNVTIFEPAATPTASVITANGFTANWAAESGATDYRLDVSTDGFSTFVTGYNNLTVSGTSQAITGLSPNTAYSYRVRYVNAAGTGLNSVAASQTTLCLSPTVTNAPSNASICLGYNTIFAVTGSNYTAVKWQVDPNTGTFADISNGGVYSSETTTTLNITGATAAMSGYKYQAVLTNTASGCNTTTTSSAGTLAVSHMTFGANGVSNVACHGGSNGVAVVSPIAGTYVGTISQLTYSWSPFGGASRAATGLPAGTYQVTVTDIIGCSATQTVVIGEPAVLRAFPRVNSNVSIRGGSDGAASIAATGGTPGYYYTWLPSGGSGTTATGLSAGNYSVALVDDNSCTITSNIITIFEPAATPTASAVSTTGFTASWDAETGATGYRLDLSADGFNTFVTGFQDLPVSGTTKTITGLAPGTTYSYVVRYANSGGIGVSSTISTQTTLSDAPATPAASLATAMGFTLTWPTVTGATSYLLDVSADGFSTFASGYNGLAVSGLSQAVSGLTSGTTYSFRIRAVNSGGTGANSTTGTQYIDTPPVIAGIVTNQGVNDNATINPFSGVTITDVETSQTQTVSVSFDNAAKGTFSTLNGFTDAGGGVYTFSGTAAEAQTAIQGLVYTPTPNRAPHGGTETTTFTITTNDGIAADVTDNSTTVISISVNEAPVAANTATIAYTALDAATAVSPGLTVTDPEDTDLASAVVAISNGFVAGDILSATTAGTNITTGYDDATGILSLSGSETIAHYQQVLQSVTFSNPSRNPTVYGANPSRVVSYTVSDGALNSASVNATVNITASNDATLSALTLSAGTLSPAFDANTTTYTATTTATSLTIVPTKTDADATLQIQFDGGGFTDITSGTASSDLSLQVGANTIDLKLTAPNGTIKTYTTTITRKIQPVITVQPTSSSQTAFVDKAPVPLTVTASGGSGFTYQWYSNTAASNTGGTPISLPIGTSYAGAGGKVGYILQPGDPGYVAGQFNGIIVAPTDAGEGAEWGCQGTSVSTSFNIGFGLSNTNNMISSCGTPGTAAQLAHAYNANGFTDWFLPSYNEMNKFFINRAAIGGFSNSGYYWTSSQYNGNEAYGAGFDNGDNGLGHGTKSDGDRVRAARYFSIADTFAPLSATVGTTYYYVIVTNSDGLSVTSEVSGPVVVNLQPVITASRTLLELNTTYGTASANTSIIASGDNLTSDIAVTAPTGFEVSIDATSGFANTIALTQYGGTTLSTRVYVRLAANAPVGTYNGDVALTSTDAVQVNMPTASSTVNTMAITVTADANSKIYGIADPTLTYTLTSGALANGDSFTGALTRDAGEDVGDYAITQGDLALSANYVLNYAGANLTITNATLTGITLADATVTYDGDPKNLVVADLPDGATVAYTGNTRTNVGVYPVTATISKTNYDDLVLTANLTISNATLTGTTLTDAGFTYDGAAKSLVAADVPDGATVIYNGNEQTDAGTYPVTATISKANYDDLLLTANLSITAKSISVTARPKGKVYGRNDPVLTYTVTPALIGGDTFTGSLSRDSYGTLAGEQVNSYAITQGSLTAGANYQVTYTGNTLTISPSPLSVTAGVQNKPYGAADPALTYTASGLINRIADGVTVNDVTGALTGGLSRNAGELVGTYAINQGSLTTTNNYTVTYNTNNLTITPTITNEAELYKLVPGIGTATKVSSTAYTISVIGLTIDRLHLRATTTNPRATLTVNGTAVISGESTGDLILNTGTTPTVIPIVILAEDGVTTKTVQVTVNHIASANNNLGSLALTGGQVPAQATATTYTASVTSAQVTVRATVADPVATVKINGTAVASGQYSNPISLAIGANTITTTIIAEDGTSKTYTLTVIRLQSSNNDLKALVITGGQIPTTINATTFTANIIGSTITVRATAADVNATVKINGTAIAPGAYSDNISLAIGSNTITTVITAEDGTSKTYTLTVTRLQSSNNDLKALAISGGQIPAQASAAAFTATVTAPTVTVRATAADANAAIRINGTAIASGVYSDAISLAIGANTITTIITAEDGTPKTYTLTVTRLASPNNDLKSLALNGGITVTQASATTYSATVTATTVTVRAITADAGAAIRINGVTVASGAYSGTINLTTGVNTITTLVTAEDGTTKTYTLAVTRLQSSNNDLKSLALNGGIAVTQASATTYSATVTATTIMVRATAADAGATIRINGVSVASGIYSANVFLTTGVNTITTVVTAEDGTPKTYTLTVTRLPSANNDLKSLVLNGGITAAKASATEYTATAAGAGTTTVKVRATVADAGATVRINGTTVASGVYSGDIGLTGNSTPVTVAVTAENGATATYTLTITRPAISLAVAARMVTDETIPPPGTIIPTNILSPNGDGKNDTWVVKDIQFYTDNAVTVYDHSGKVVYTKKGYDNNWDGTAKGSPLPQGTYYYIVTLGAGIPAIKGFITILTSH
jgi:gliding motility-associated-like protein